MGITQKEFNDIIPELIKKIEAYPQEEFFLADIFPDPQGHAGVFFNQAVRAHKIPNVEFIGVVPRRGDKYRKITE